MKNILNHRQDGFTLVELLLVMIIMGIVGLALTNFISTWLQTAGISQARANLLNSAEIALDDANNDIMLSGNVDQTNRWPDPNGPGGSPYGWQSNSQTLILAKVATDSSGNPIFLDSSDYITQKDDVIYFLNGTNLYRRVLASNSTNDSAVTTCPASDATSTCPPDTLIASGVTNWLVSYYNAQNQVVTPSSARSIQLSITLSEPYGSQIISASYTTRMVFRNV
jgi:prepilin-type N-terminal cleavage/methylation domain-containing protein